MNPSIGWMILQLCWGCFCVVWLAGGLYNLVRGPRTQRRILSLPILTIGVVLIVLIVLAARLGLLRPLKLGGLIPLRAGLLAGPSSAWLELIGAICLVAATALALWARFTLGTMWSNMPVAKVGHQLRTDGPYAITRHPIYTGMMGMFLGSLLMNVMSGFGVWLLIAVIGTAIILPRVPTEEKLMIDTFGEQYRAYQRRVPQLIPGLQLLQKSISGMSRG